MEVTGREGLISPETTSSTTFAADGSANPTGVGGWAFVSNSVGISKSGVLHPTDTFLCTNNFAEYNAIHECLLYAQERGFHGFTVYMDSQLVVYQISGAYRVKASNLIDIAGKVKKLVSDMEVDVVWVPRSHPLIKEADKLSKVPG